MYPPDCIHAPRSCQALPPVGRHWPSNYNNDEGNNKDGGDDVDDNHNEENEYGAYRAQMLTPLVSIARQDASKDTTNIFFKEDEAF